MFSSFAGDTEKDNKEEYLALSSVSSDQLTLDDNHTNMAAWEAPVAVAEIEFRTPENAEEKETQHVKQILLFLILEQNFMLKVNTDVWRSFGLEYEQQINMFVHLLLHSAIFLTVIPVHEEHLSTLDVTAASSELQHNCSCLYDELSETQRWDAFTHTSTAHRFKADNWTV